MLVSITEKCRMGCSHCMDDAKADCNKFMTRDIFEKVIDFHIKHHDMIITITGGEPTEHPYFWDFMKILANKISNQTIIVAITTNGMNLSDLDIDRIMELDKISKGKFTWQVSSIPPYYPIQIDLNQNVFKLKNMIIETTITNMMPVGRAKNHPEWKFYTKSPQCFNTRSIMRSTQNLNITIAQLRARMRFCTPQISYEGYIKVGESMLCPPVAHITDDESVIVSKICNFTCSDCKDIVDKMPDNYRAAIGEK